MNQWQSIVEEVIRRRSRKLERMGIVPDFSHNFAQMTAKRAAEICELKGYSIALDYLEDEFSMIEATMFSKASA